MDKKDVIFSQMEEDKYTLIINYPVLRAGGIETYLVSMMRSFLQQGHRVIWITTTQHRNNVDFKGLVDDPRLEIVIWEKWERYFGIPQIRFQEHERVILFCCRAIHYIVGEEMKRRAKCREFRQYYGVAHFTGEAYYPDSGMKTTWGKRITYQYWQKILRRLVSDNCLWGFSLPHLENYDTYYRVPIADKESRLLPTFELRQTQFDWENTAARERERDQHFVITTCARLEFPHKAYILGLVDSFCALKEKYPQIVLQIIGGGSGEKRLKEKIAKLPEHIWQDIKLTGFVSPDDLELYYKQSHVIVGLAGAIAEGAWSGIPSIVVRHYCDVCEAYGFYADAYDQTLSEEKGEEITPLLEHCITMSADAYMQHGRDGFLVELGFQAEESTDFFGETGQDSLQMLSASDRLLGRILYVITELKNRFDR